MPETAANPPNKDDSHRRERRCPVCGVRMTEQEEQGVKIDECSEHGVWLDKGELKTILDNLRRTKRKQWKQVVERRRREALAKGRDQGAFFGWLSLLFPDD